MNSLPTGTVTFAFTDIECSTKLVQQYPDEMPGLLARHNKIMLKYIHGSVTEGSTMTMEQAVSFSLED